MPVVRAYASLAALKTRLGEATNERDADLDVYLLAASEAISNVTHRDFGPGTRTEYGRGSGPVIVPMASPIQAVTSFTVEGLAVTPKIELGRTAVGRADRQDIVGEWELTYETIAVVPEMVVLATLMTAQAMSDAPAFDLNLNGVSVAGVIQGGFQAQGAGYIPPGAMSLLQSGNLIRVGFA